MDLLNIMEIPRRTLYLLDTTNSVLRRFCMTENATSLSPDTLSHLMLPRVLEVVVTRSCEALIHCADALPVGTAKNPIKIMVASSRLAVTSVKEIRRDYCTKNERDWHGTRGAKLPVDQVDADADLDETAPYLV